MKIFFDSEFTGLQKNTDLISLGLVSEDGKELYLEFKDFDRDKCDSWIKENVLENTIIEGNKSVTDIVSDDLHYYEGTKEELKGVLLEWLSWFKEDIQLVSDVCHYDMMLFIDIFGSAFDLPKNVSPVCHDINQDIAKYYGISEKAAFDMDRESIMREGGIDIVGDKHNSLYDARVIETIYKIVNFGA